jgi:hypothetical protein
MSLNDVTPSRSSNVAAVGTSGCRLTRAGDTTGIQGLVNPGSAHVPASMQRSCRSIGPDSHGWAVVDRRDAGPLVRRAAAVRRPDDG